MSAARSGACHPRCVNRLQNTDCAVRINLPIILTPLFTSGLCGYFSTPEKRAVDQRAPALNGEEMKFRAGLLIILLSASGAVRAEPADELSGCVGRERAQQYLIDHNYAELLRGESANGKTLAVWTTGVKILVLSFQTPKVPGSGEVRTICVDATASRVAFSLEVIEKLIGAAAASTRK